MGLNIMKLLEVPKITEVLKDLIKQTRKKPKTVITAKQAKPKPLQMVAKTKPAKQKPKYFYDTVTPINGVGLTLKQISEQYHFKLKTIEARYRAGSRGKQLIRPLLKKKPT